MAKQSREALKALIKSDVFRYTGGTSKADLFTALRRNRGFLLTLSYRLNRHCLKNERRGIGAPLRLIHRALVERIGCELYATTAVGPGLRINHAYGTVINSGSRIGRDVTLCQGVCLGQADPSDPTGTPTIGDRVYLAPGSQVIGKVVVGDDVIVGANAVVLRNVPDGAIATGTPADIHPNKRRPSFHVNSGYDDPDLPPPEEW